MPMPISNAVFTDGSAKVIPYERLRDQIRDGDLMLCSGSAVFSRLIQVATESIWSHVGFVMWLPSLGRLMVLESVESAGVRSVPLSSYLGDYNGTGRGYPGNVLIARHDDFANRALTDEFIEFAVDRFGWPYHADQIVNIAARIASRGILGKVHPDTDKERAFICSEYVDACYRRLGVTVHWDQFGFVAPADFANDRKVHAIGILDTTGAPK